MKSALTQARFLFERARYEQALEELQLATRADPLDVQAQGMKALSLLALGHKQQALSAAYSTIHADVNHAFSHYVMARACFASGRADDAERAIQKAIGIAPDRSEYFAYFSGILFEQRKWQAALDAAERGLALDAQNIFCRTMKSRSCARLGRKKEAHAAAVLSLKQDPNSALSFASKAWLLLEKGDYSDALVCFREALRIDPGLDWARMGLLECLKSRHPVYRLLLRWFHACAEMTYLKKLLFVLGFFALNLILMQVVQSIPSMLPLILPVQLLYLAAVFLTWAGGPLFNLILRWDAFGKHVLTREESQAARWTGICLGTGVLSAGIGWGIGWDALFLTGSALATFVIPLGGTFSVRDGTRKQLLVGYTVFLGLMLAAAVLVGVSQAAPLNMFSYIYLGGVLLFGWVANALAS